MKRSKKQRRERIYRVKNLKRKTAQNKQHIVRHIAAVTADKIKWRWQWTEKVIRTKTTTMIMMTATAAAAMIVTNWAEKFSHLNRISKEIRTKIKSIYDKTICFLDTHFIKKEINEQKAATNKFRLQSIYNRSFAVQWVHKIYLVICTHNLSVFTQQSYSDRTVCSALKIVCAVFFDLIFFFYAYQKRSFFFFFFFSINLKKITICNADMNLMKQWKFNSNDRTDTAAMMKKEI